MTTTNRIWILVLACFLGLLNTATGQTRHRVKSGETLWGIAHRYDANFNEVHSANPNFKSWKDERSGFLMVLIHPGDVVLIPDVATDANAARRHEYVNRAAVKPNKQNTSAKQPATAKIAISEDAATNTGKVAPTNSTTNSKALVHSEGTLPQNKWGQEAQTQPALGQMLKKDPEEKQSTRNSWWTTPTSITIFTVYLLLLLAVINFAPLRWKWVLRQGEEIRKKLPEKEPLRHFVSQLLTSKLQVTKNDSHDAHLAPPEPAQQSGLIYSASDDPQQIEQLKRSVQHFLNSHIIYSEKSRIRVSGTRKCKVFGLLLLHDFEGRRNNANFSIALGMPAHELTLQMPSGREEKFFATIPWKHAYRSILNPGNGMLGRGIPLWFAVSQPHEEPASVGTVSHIAQS